MRPKIEEAGTIGLIARLPDIGNLSPADGDIADGTIAGGMIANTKYKICPRWRSLYDPQEFGLLG